MTVSQKLAEFFVSTNFDELPAKVVENSKIVIANTIASAAAGSSFTSVDIIRKVVKDRGGKAESTIWFDRGPKMYVSDAARLNAMMSDAAAADDSHMKGGHVGTVTVAAALAAAERSAASGRDLLSAVALGYEAGGRIGEAIYPTVSRRGFHGCVITIFGGTVAAGKVLGLNEAQLAHAIGLAATSIGGLEISTNTITREYHAGLSAMQGVNAVMAALNGYTCEENLLEARGGFLETFGGNVDVESVTSGLGKDWDIVTEMALKLIPGTHQMHALVEAAIIASKKGSVRPNDVESITVFGSDFLQRHIKLVRPRDFAGAVHSLPYYMAAAVADKDFSWNHTTMEKVNDRVIVALQEKVRLEVVSQTDSGSRLKGGTVRITTKDGNEYSHTVDWPKGSAIRGIHWDDVDAKYSILVPRSGMSTEMVESSLQMIHGCEILADVGSLTALLRP